MWWIGLLIASACFQVGVHSASANAIVKTMLQERLLTDLLPYTALRQEIKYGQVSLSLAFAVLAMLMCVDAHFCRYGSSILCPYA